MGMREADGFVAFENVTVITSAANALQYRIGRRRVWLARLHVRGRMWNVGDRGTLQVRRWVARDRRLIAPPCASGPAAVARSISRHVLHVVRRERFGMVAGATAAVPA